ncbi:MAG: SlyX family protein [Victivallales bacterium]|jgi:SlyX protein|nr:SlyX family protein [Victivallales bacterium]MBT7162554.1 SlyX family protein [Victivallales bacterium]MBT7303212.1 SlyX family protein [Victivallales bacterium]
MNDERLVQIETKIAFLEHTIDELNDVFLDVRAQVDRIEKALVEAKEQLEANANNNIDPSFQKPPHY